RYREETLPKFSLNPVTISSKINNISFLLQYSSKPFKKLISAGIQPPPPNNGSIIMHARSYFTLSSNLIDLSKLLNGIDSTKSPSLPVIPTPSSISNG